MELNERYATAFLTGIVSSAITAMIAKAYAQPPTPTATLELHDMTAWGWHNARGTLSREVSTPESGDAYVIYYVEAFPVATVPYDVYYRLTYKDSVIAEGTLTLDIATESKRTFDILKIENCDGSNILMEVTPDEESHVTLATAVIRLVIS